MYPLRNTVNRATVPLVFKLLGGRQDLLVFWHGLPDDKMCRMSPPIFQIRDVPTINRRPYSP